MRRRRPAPDRPPRPVRAALRDLALALLVGAVLAVPASLWLGSAPFTLRATFRAPVEAAAVEALRAWAAARPGIEQAQVEAAGRSVTLTALRRGTLRTAITPPWDDLGFPPLKSYRLANRFDPAAMARDPVFLLSMVLAAQAGFLAVAGARRRSLPPVAGPAPGRALALGAAAGVLLAGFGWAYGRLLPASGPWEAVRGFGPGARVVVVALAVGLAPVAEELFFRRLLLGRFLRAGRAGAGVAVTAALFAVVHPVPAHLPALFVFGVALAWLARRTDGLLAPWAAHAVANAAAFALLLA